MPVIRPILPVWASAVPCFFRRGGRVHRPRQREVQRTEQSRAGRRGGRRSVIVSHLRSLIPDRGPTPAHLGVGLSPLRYLVYCGLSTLPVQSQTAWAYRLQYFLWTVFSVQYKNAHAQAHAHHTQTTHRVLVRGRLSGTTACCLLHLIFFSLPARWLALLYQEPTSPPPPFCPCSANMRPSHDAQPHKSIISPWILCKV